MVDYMELERRQGLNNGNGMKWIGKPFSLGYHAGGAGEIVDPFDNFEEPTGDHAVAVDTRRDWEIPTEPQMRFLRSLLSQKIGLEGAELEAKVEEFRARTRREVSKDIETMKNLPNYVKPAAKAESVAEGMYRDPETGDIYKVQVAHHGSGNLYAKILVKLDEVRIKRNKEYSHDFQYAAGAIRKIKPEWRMTREEAAEWGSLYGACCRCGTILTDEGSIARGIGPICADKF